MKNLMARYEVQLLILPTRAPFRLKIPTYLSKRIFFKISESGLQNKKIIKQGNRRPQLTGYTWLWKYRSEASSLDVPVTINDNANLRICLTDIWS